jgi:methylmalonyl-CoA carboxyltransferase 12S subunit
LPLEQRTMSAPAAPEVYPEPAAAEADEEISPEILLAISAAVAAYLGEPAHIRAVRLVGHTRWSQEGRVSIQASHYLNRG